MAGGEIPESEEELYACPECLYAVPKTQWQYARFDFDCPRCGTHRLSRFEPFRNLAEVIRKGLREEEALFRQARKENEE